MKTNPSWLLLGLPIVKIVLCWPSTPMSTTIGGSLLPDLVWTERMAIRSPAPLPMQTPTETHTHTLSQLLRPHRISPTGLRQTRQLNILRPHPQQQRHTSTHIHHPTHTNTNTNNTNTNININNTTHINTHSHAHSSHRLRVRH